MEGYLRPITLQLDSIFRPSSASTTSKNKNAEKEPPQEYVVLLCDPDLMQLPLEALNSLQSESIVSVSREISLQMLYHKIQVIAFIFFFGGWVGCLAAPDLMQLPLEVLNSLQSETIVSVSREISLQMLYHKIQVNI